MMKRTLTALLLLFPLVAIAQVAVEARLDTADILIGEQVDVRLRLTADAKSQILWPNVQEGALLTEGVEVIRVSQPDTVLLNDGKRLQMERRYTITSFDSALYVIPPFTVQVDGKEYASRGTLGLKVSTVEVDTLHVDQFRDAHAVVMPPFEWRWTLTCLALLLIIIIVAVYWLAARLSKKTPMQRRRVIYPPAPAHVTALAAIERLGKRPGAAEESDREQVKAYYAALTDTLRQYIAERFGFNAREMTTSEITRRLLDENNTDALAELRSVMQQADLVKFAKQEVSLSDEDRALQQALSYVQTTKHEPATPPQPRVVYENVEARTQQRVRRALIALTATLSLAAIGLMAYLCEEIYNNFL